MKEKITAGEAPAAAPEQVTFTLPLYQLADFNTESIRSTFPCEGVYIAETPDKVLHMVEVITLSDGTANCFSLPVSLILDHAAIATKQHLLDEYIRNIHEQLMGLDDKMDKHDLYTATRNGEIAEKYKNLCCAFDESNTRLDELKNILVALKETPTSQGAITAKDLIEIIHSVRK